MASKLSDEDRRCWASLLEWIAGAHGDIRHAQIKFDGKRWDIRIGEEFNFSQVTGETVKECFLKIESGINEHWLGGQKNA